MGLGWIFRQNGLGRRDALAGLVGLG